MRILYLSCHLILEYDEVSLFHELGYEVFSPGAYFNPSSPGEAALRPGIDGLTYDPKHVELFNQIGQNHPGQDGKDYLTKELVDCFDAIVVMHIPRWITNNWEVIKHKRVIWRTIGQSISHTEKLLAPYRAQGLEIVRYSPMERNIPGFIGEDALIRFYKDSKDYCEWNGKTKRVITFAQNMKDRDAACNFSFFEKVTRPFPRHLFGPLNENVGDWATGAVPYSRLKEEMRNNRVYFYTGTHPASYTLNFIEAFLTGIPIVAIGSMRGNSANFQGHNLYEIPYMIKNGVNGFVSDNEKDLQKYIKQLFINDEFAKQIGKEGRRTAIQFFGKDTVKQQWRDYFGN